MMATTSSITVQSLGKIVQRCRCAVGAKMWCFVCLFVGHALRPEHHAFEGCIFRTSIALPFIAQFRRGFQLFFHKGLLFRMHYLVRIFVARWHHNFREIAVKNCEKSKNRRKRFCAPFVQVAEGFEKKPVIANIFFSFYFQDDQDKMCKILLDKLISIGK